MLEVPLGLGEIAGFQLVASQLGQDTRSRGGAACQRLQDRPCFFNSVQLSKDSRQPDPGLLASRESFDPLQVLLQCPIKPVLLLQQLGESGSRQFMPRLLAEYFLKLRFSLIALAEPSPVDSAHVSQVWLIRKLALPGVQQKLRSITIVAGQIALQESRPDVLRRCPRIDQRSEFPVGSRVEFARLDECQLALPLQLFG